MKIKNRIIKNIGLYICLIYILLRPFLNTYVTEYIKYFFIFFMVYYAFIGIINNKINKKIGFLEIFLCVIFIFYVIISSLFMGGLELFWYTMERYIFYMIPIFVIPVIKGRVNWNKLLSILTWYGVIDSIVSIIEFITHKQIFALGGVRHNIVQLYGDDSIRTFGLNGNYFLLAELLCVCGFASIYKTIFMRQKKELWKFIIISIGIFTTGSRGYYVAYFVGICVIFFMYNIEKGISANTFFRIVIAVLLVFFILCFVFFTNINIGISGIDTILARLRSITDFNHNLANVERVRHWTMSFDRWKRHPLFGNGASFTDVRYSKFEFVTESGLFKRLVELGIVGTLLQYITMIIPLYKGIEKYKKNKIINKIMVFFFAVIAAFLTEDLVLQRYGEIEYTIIMWSSLSFISTVDSLYNVKKL